VIDKCTSEELQEFADICKVLRANNLRLHCRDTARRKPKEVRLLLVQKHNNKAIGSA